MVERVQPSIVWIGTELGTGSGAIFEANPSARTALILTNHHVIEGARRIQVLVNDSTTYTAVIVGADLLRDLAVLRIRCSIDFRAVPFGDATQLKSGTEVLAIGYPQSTLLELLAIEGGQTVTRGIVSATRYDSIADAHLIQTDAPINPGNSGGPLLTASGEIIGINTFGLLFSLGGTPLEGFGFAVSEETISPLLPDLLVGSQITTPETPLGVTETRFTNDTHWYTLQVPRDWTIDSSDPGGVVLWNPDSPVPSSIDVRVSFTAINPGLYPTLSSYVATNQPIPLSGWEQFLVVSQEGIRTNFPVVAHRFNYRYGPEVAVTRVIEDWYHLGQFLAVVSATASSDIWQHDQYLDDRQQLNLVLDGFQPSAFTSGDDRFSVAHPPAWQVLPGGIADYWAEDDEARRRVVVQVRSAEGHTSVNSYANEVRLITGETLRQAVFENRPNPSFRIEYSALSTFLDPGPNVKGVALITLSGPDAFWAYVEGRPQDWEATKLLADDILLRFAVRG